MGEAAHAAERAAGPDGPADVVALCAWANVKGVPYRDFSASRREFRAGIRHQAALAKRDAEAKAKAEAEQAAALAVRGAQQASATARLHAAQARRAAERQAMKEAAAEEEARDQALRRAEHLSRQAATERMGAARHAEALRAAEQTARREALEIACARVAANAGSRFDGPAGSGGEPDAMWTDRLNTKQHRPAESSALSVLDESGFGMDEVEHPSSAEMVSVRIPLKRDLTALLPPGGEDQANESEADDQNGEATDPRAALPLPQLSASETARTVEQYARSMKIQDSAGVTVDRLDAPKRPTELFEARPQGAAASEPDFEGRQGSPESMEVNMKETSSPSWFQPLSRGPAGTGERLSGARESLQHTRERVAARWYALRGVFQQNSGPAEETAAVRLEEQTPPVLAIYSVAGGVGKTSLAASLTRALAAQGERVLLVDATERGILPFYLGARDLRPGVVRTFAPPPGSTDRPIHLVTYGRDTGGTGTEQNESLPDRIFRHSTGFHRVIVDLPSAASGMLHSLVQSGADVLVPVVPDMNSIVSLQAVRRELAGRLAAGRPESPAFLLNQFDPAQPLQLDVREILQQQLGESLLPFAIRRSPVIAEALAEGMTVMDYAPGEGIAKDYLQVASWVRTVAEPVRQGIAQARWREQ